MISSRYKKDKSGEDAKLLVSTMESLLGDEEETVCRQCGFPIESDSSPGVWVHSGDDGPDLNEDHAPVPDDPALDATPPHKGQRY